MATSIKLNDMVTLFRKELELCGVKEGEKVVVLSELGQAEDYTAASMLAARALGAQVFNVNLLPTTGLSAEEKTGNVGRTALAGNRTAIEALKRADLVIDLMFLLFSKEQLEIQAAGTRILLIAEPFEVLVRLFPSQELRERVVRMVLEHRDEYDSQWAAILSIAEKFGMSPETLRIWVRRVEVDAGHRPGITTEERERLRVLERENKELRRANEILKSASAFFAAELDRPLKR